MHHPIGFGSFSGTSPVVNQGFLEADAVVGFAAGGINRLVYPGCLPKPGSGNPVRSHTVPVLPPSDAEEIPFLVTNMSPNLFISSHHANNQIKELAIYFVNIEDLMVQCNHIIIFRSQIK